MEIRGQHTPDRAPQERSMERTSRKCRQGTAAASRTDGWGGAEGGEELREGVRKRLPEKAQRAMPRRALAAIVRTLPFSLKGPMQQVPGKEEAIVAVWSQLVGKGEWEALREIRPETYQAAVSRTVSEKRNLWRVLSKGLTICCLFSKDHSDCCVRNRWQ